MSKLLKPQKLRYCIEIFEEETVMTQVCDDGSERRFVVAPEQLQRILKLPSPPVLVRPEPGLLHVAADMDVETHLFAIPAKCWNVSIEGKARPKSHRVELPAFLLEAKVRRNDRKIIGISAWTHGAKTFRSSNILYEMPLPNFSQNGSMCLGSVNVTAPEGTSVREAALEAVFGSAFNAHHGTVGRKGIGFVAFLTENGGRLPLCKLVRVGPANKVVRSLASQS